MKGEVKLELSELDRLRDCEKQLETLKLSGGIGIIEQWNCETKATFYTQKEIIKVIEDKYKQDIRNLENRLDEETKAKNDIKQKQTKFEQFLLILNRIVIVITLLLGSGLIYGLIDNLFNK